MATLLHPIPRRECRLITKGKTEPGSRQSPIAAPALQNQTGPTRRGSGQVDIFLDTIALTIGALLPIMNPFSTAPLFVSLTANFDRPRQRQQAFLACVYAFGILAVFL